MTDLEPEIERSLRRYVLGSLEEDSRLQLEEKLVQDPDTFELLGVIEDELTEEYLDVTLTEDEKRGLERHSLSSPNRRGVPEFFSALRTVASTSADAEPEERIEAARWFGSLWSQPAWLGAAATLLVASLAANVWLALRAPSPVALDVTPVAVSGEEPSPSPAIPSEPASHRLAELEETNRELEARLASERQQVAEAQARVQALETASARPTTAIPTFALAAGLLRSGGSLTRVVVPADVDVVRLALDLPADEYPLYRAALEDVDGNEVWAQSRLKAETKEGQVVVSVLVPAGALAHGDYQMKVSGLAQSGELESLSRYTFRALPD
jgi:hypothetical protein